MKPHPDGAAADLFWLRLSKPLRRVWVVLWMVVADSRMTGGNVAFNGTFVADDHHGSHPIHLLHWGWLRRRSDNGRDR